MQHPLCAWRPFADSYQARETKRGAAAAGLSCSNQEKSAKERTSFTDVLWRLGRAGRYASFLILKMILSMPLRNFGLFTTTIFMANLLY